MTLFEPAAGMQHLSFTAEDQDRGTRLDVFLAAQTQDMSRARVQALIKEGFANVNGRAIGAPNHRVQAGDHVSLAVPEPEPSEPQPEAIPLNVVYEDNDIIVIDKPAGLVVHPAAGNWTGTLVNALLAHCGDSLSGIGGVRRPGIVHRLDKDTSGLMVAAKNDRAHRGLKAQFADHGRSGGLLREYQALVWGKPVPAAGRIATRIARHPTNRLKYAVARERGREAVTNYRTLQTFFVPGANQTAAALIACRLETGRTHQIRVHMAHVGHPVMGDPVYASGFKNRMAGLPQKLRSAIIYLAGQALHASVLGIEHPVSRAHLHFTSEPPDDMCKVIAAMAPDTLRRRGTT